MRFRSKMAFQNFENVIYFDEVRNEFSQEIGKSSISHEFEKISCLVGLDPEMERNFS